MGSGCIPSDEVGSKREWSILEAVEFRSRDKTHEARLTFVSLDGYHVVGIKSTSGELCWVLLNPRFSPMIKEVPKLEYRLARDEYQRIISEGEVAVEVRSHLRRRIYGDRGDR